MSDRPIIARRAEAPWDPKRRERLETELSEARRVGQTWQAQLCRANRSIKGLREQVKNLQRSQSRYKAHGIRKSNDCDKLMQLLRDQGWDDAMIMSELRGVEL